MFIRRFVLWAEGAPVGEGVVWSDGRAIVNKKGADFEIYASFEDVGLAYRPERGFKLAMEPRT